MSRSAQEEGDVVQPTITHVNPDGMHQNPAFSQAVVVEGAARTIYVGGQNAVDAEGKIVGAGDLAAQTEQVLKNIETVLAASGAGRDDVVKWTILVVQGQDINAGFGAFQRVWGTSPRPPVITFAFVAGLANPEFLVEIEVMAVTGAGAG
jgi:enamine deaminase RidA (YjgF/YER057c/UK114 family)